jgi:hypothetical protein
MFTSLQRDRLRSELLDRAAADGRIAGSAITGSAATGCEDVWSDIDLAFGVTHTDEIPAVLSDWTSLMCDQHGAVHHVDVKSGAWIYRVFLLPNTLQVDIALVSAAEFRPLAPSFRLVHGKASEPRHAPPPAAADIIGFAWLYALHARSSIARRKLWQAEYMISGVRDHALSLACLRYGVPVAHGRGIDHLPIDATEPFEGSLVRQLETAELARAFGVVVAGLLNEIRHADEQLAERLRGPLALLSV